VSAGDERNNGSEYERHAAAKRYGNGTRAAVDDTAKDWTAGYAGQGHGNQ